MVSNNRPACRICPGKTLAEESVFILIAHLIWTFSFAVDESEGLAPEFTEDLVRYVFDGVPTQSYYD